MKEIFLIFIISCLAVLLANIENAIILNEEKLIMEEYNNLINERDKADITLKEEKQ